MNDLFSEVKNFKILVIDDSDIIRDSMKKFLESFGIIVLTTDSGLSGVRISLEEKPNLIFLDLMMPKFGGIDTIKTLKVLNETKHIPIIIITNYQDPDLQKTAMNLGAVKVLEKPLSKKSIIDAIEGITGKNFLSRIKFVNMVGRTNTKTPESATIGIDEKWENRIKLIKTFKELLNTRKNELIISFESRNIDRLLSIAGELKTIGLKVGHNKIIYWSELLEKYLQNPKELDDIKWAEIREFINEIIYILEIQGD